MPRWLLKASRKSREPAPAAPYVIRCFCGRVVRGQRESGWQEVACDRCGETVFVLPRDAYPEIAAPQPGAAAALKSVPPSGARLGKLRARWQALVARVRTVPGVAAGVLQEWIRRGRRQITPLRLIVLGVMAILLLTTWWVWSVHAREQALLTLGRAVERGEQALAERDLATAAVEFRQAAEALDVLGREDAAAQRLRQLDRECEAATRLATASIPEMIEEAQRARENNPAADWRDRFRTAYGDRWVVLDTLLHRIPRAKGGFDFRIEYPLSVGGLPVALEADLPAFRQLAWTGDSRPVVFAAPAVDCRLSPADPKRWIVQLDGKRGFLWVHNETYQGLGFVPDEFRSEAAVRQMLAEQSGDAGPQKAEVH